LFNTQVSVDTCVTGCASEVFVFAVGDVEMSFWVTVFFGETKVDYVDLVAAFADAHEEVVGFDVAVDKGFGVDVLDAGDLMSVSNWVGRGGGEGDGRGGYELVCEEEDCFEGEFAGTKVEEVFKGRTK
jgi:hypothetical protein